MTITIPDLTVAETKGLQRVTNLYNAEVAAATPQGQTPVVLTPANYFRQRVLDLVADWTSADLDADRTTLSAAYRTATDTQRQAARTALGLP